MDQPFKCPECGGSHFGRDTSTLINKVVVLQTVRCHDEFRKGCKWRGEWKSEYWAKPRSGVVYSSPPPDETTLPSEIPQ